MIETTETRRKELVALRARLERELRRARDRVGKKKAELELLEAERDRLVVELRRLPDPPSSRHVAGLAGISAPWVLKLERDDG